jgi:hypothetical protein
MGQLPRTVNGYENFLNKPKSHGFGIFRLVAIWHIFPKALSQIILAEPQKGLAKDLKQIKNIANYHGYGCGPNTK